MTIQANSTGTSEARDDGGSSSIRLRWQMASLAAITFGVCCLRLFVHPHTPLLLWGDAPGYATKGVRILGGELPYRDFFEFLTPGTDLVYALLFRCFGVSLAVPHLLMATLAALAAAWLTWCADRLVRGWIVLLPAVLLIGFILSSSLDPTHHWFSTVALMGAVWVLFNGRSLGRAAAAGAFCGLAASFTQTKGAAATIGLVAYFFWIAVLDRDRTRQWIRSSLVLCGAALAVFAVINGPFIVATGVGRWAWDVVVFPMRYFGSVSANNLAGPAEWFAENPGRLKWICFPFQFFVVPLTYLWFFVEFGRGKVKQRHLRNRLLLLAVVGVAMLAAVAPALSMRRISIASPPAMLLLAWLLSRSEKPWIALALGAVSAAMPVASIAHLQMSPQRILDLPVGRVAIPPRTDYYDVYRWMAANTTPGEWYFGLPPLALPLKLRNPAPLEGISLGEYTRPEQVNATVQGIDRTKVRIIVLRPRMYIPGLDSGLPDHLQPFRDYLYRYYRKTRTFPSGDEVWERTDN